MPRIELIEPVYYSPNDPDDWAHRNRPLEAIIARQELINLALDNVIEQVRDSVGTQNTLSARLARSLDDDGALRTSAVDASTHSIESHADTADYVRMTRVQSDKLEQISDGANHLEIEVQLDSEGNDLVTLDSGTVRFVPSSSVSFSLDSPNKVAFDLAFPAAAAHRHYYDQTPVHATPLSPDYIHYKVNSQAIAYMDGTLRVYINGIRLSSSEEVYVPGDNNVWTLVSYTPNHASGTFALSAAIQETDIIRIDYDTSFV